MIVVDTSAVVAYLRGEPEALRIEAVLAAETEVCMSSVAAFECRVVLLRRYGPRAAADFELLVAKLAVELVPFDAGAVDLATRAYARYGRGGGSPARLNLVDCASYALARSRNLPLLFKGDDFSQTDVAAVPY